MQFLNNIMEFVLNNRLDKFEYYFKSTGDSMFVQQSLCDNVNRLEHLGLLAFQVS